MATVTLSRGGSTIAQTSVTVNQTQPLFDGRAVAQGALPITSGTGNSTTQTPPAPTGVWVGTPHNGGYLYQGTDASTVADTRWGQAYQFAPASGRHNPYWTTAPPSITSAQLNKVRPLVIGDVAWYADSIKLFSQGWVWPSWSGLVSVLYQTILQDQVQLGPRASANGQSNVWTIGQTAGLITNGRAAVQYVQALKPVTFDVYTDWIIGVKAANDNTGWLEVHYRPEGGTWSQPFSKTGTPTLVWNTAPTNVGSELNDKIGVYMGWDNQTQTPAPTGTIRMRGLSRHSTLADAIASLG